MSEIRFEDWGEFDLGNPHGSQPFFYLPQTHTMVMLPYGDVHASWPQPEGSHAGRVDWDVHEFAWRDAEPPMGRAVFADFAAYMAPAFDYDPQPYEAGSAAYGHAGRLLDLLG